MVKLSILLLIFKIINFELQIIPFVSVEIFSGLTKVLHRSECIHFSQTLEPFASQFISFRVFLLRNDLFFFNW
jgi:hypothetical protein